MRLPALTMSMLFLLQAPPNPAQQQSQKASIEGAIVRIGSTGPVAGARVVLARAANVPPAAAGRMFQA